MAPRCYVLCTTPAQGHTAPLLALARRLVEEGHQVVFFTTAHYRDKVEATGAAFVPFAEEYDAHDLMVANPERESSSKRGVRGVKDDLRRIFIGPIPGQCRDLRGILDEHDPDGVVVDSMFLGALPLALDGGRRRGGAAQAPAGAGLCRRHAVPVVQPRHGTLRRGLPAGLGPPGPAAQRDHELGHRARCAGGHPAVRPPAAGRGRVPVGLPRATSSTCSRRSSTPTTRRPWPASSTRARTWPPSVRFVGPILAPPSATAFEPPPWWDELGAGRPVVHVTQGTLDNADLGRLLLLSLEALAGDDVLVVGTTGGPDPEPLRHRLPANARLERFIPHDLLLPHVDAMVTNGGYGGVQQALAHGVPLVVAGNSEDKPEVAARVRWSGAGVDLHTGRPSQAMVARAVRRVLTRPGYRRRARALQAEIAASDPLDTISTALADLTANRDARRERVAGSGRAAPQPPGGR